MNVNNYLTVLDELKSVPDTNTDKLIRVAGVITEYVKEAYDIDLIVVGGLSVEIYTEGGYTTQDIDFVGVNHEKIMQALSDLGFRREGRNSIHDELKIFVEVPDSVLKDADEHYIRNVTTEDGFELSVIGVEDIIKDRLVALVQWDEFMQDEWIYQLIQKHHSKLDIPYIRNTLDKAERELFDYFYDIVKEVDASEKRQFELILYLQREGIPYSLFELGKYVLIAFPAINGEYYGLSLSPIVMGYTYEEDVDGEDTFVAIRDSELRLSELRNWLNSISNKEVKNIDKIKDYLNELINE